jgi:hypothetical protein
MITMARQGNKTMHRYPFVKSRNGLQTARPVRPDNLGDIRLSGKSCHLCDESDDGPGYDLWHVLFECPATSTHADVTAVCESSVSFLLRLCDAIDEAVRFNGTSMSNTEHAGVSHQDIFAAVARVRDAVPMYNWKCVPGQWLTYTLLLALPFSARVVRPDTVTPFWLCKPKRHVRGIQRERDLTGMPTELELQELPDDQYLLPELVGAMFDRTVLAGDAVRLVADMWCRHALDGLFRVGRVVRPLRETAERVRAAAIALEEGDADERLTTSGMSSSDSDAGSGSPADSVSEP